MAKIGFFGGSFNPPHLGHLLAATYSLSVFDLDEIWFAPVFHHPFAKSMIPFDDRYEMCKLLIAKFKPPFRVTKIEKTLDKNGITFFTLDALRKKYKQHQFSLIVGSDLTSQLPRWNNYKELKEEFEILVVPRGLQNDPSSIPNISSTNIRAEQYSVAQLKKVVTPEIYKYLRDKKIY